MVESVLHAHHSPELKRVTFVSLMTAFSVISLLMKVESVNHAHMEWSRIRPLEIALRRRFKSPFAREKGRFFQTMDDLAEDVCHIQELKIITRNALEMYALLEVLYHGLEPVYNAQKDRLQTIWVDSVLKEYLILNVEIEKSTLMMDLAAKNVADGLELSKATPVVHQTNVMISK